MAKSKGNLKMKQLFRATEAGALIPVQKLGQRIKDLRDALGMTQRQMAKKLKVKQPVISRIEENAESCTLKTLVRIAQTLECNFMGAVVAGAPLQNLVRNQAEKAAKRILSRTYANMAMEKQQPGKKEYDYQFRKLTEELITNPNPKLWDEFPNNPDPITI
jgi:predicted DNA-binding mobile mystery protein A